MSFVLRGRRAVVNFEINTLVVEMSNHIKEVCTMNHEATARSAHARGARCSDAVYRAYDDINPNHKSPIQE